MNYAKTAKPDFVPTIELCGVVMKAILTVGSKLEGAPEQEFLKLAKLAHRALGDVDDVIVLRPTIHILTFYYHHRVHFVL